MFLKYILALVVTTGLVLANDALNENKSPPRIVGGYIVDPAFKYPWMVQIARLGRHYCGGTLYNDDTVITAAHCSAHPPDNYTVSVHRHNLTATDEEENGHTYNVTKILVHPDYGVGSDFTNDIAIWKLDRSYPNKKPKLSLDVDDLSGKTGTLLKVIGWGRTASNKTASSVLLEVKIPVYKISKCISDYKAANETVDPKTQFCAAYPEGGKDSCQGDSGGPMFVEQYGKSVLLGVVSWGIGCALPGYPGVYTKVNTFIDWIKQNV